MGAFRFSSASKAKLAKVHPDLRRVMERALELTEIDFGITEGKRTLQRQKALVAQGHSKTLNSRHLTGHAVDVAAYVDGKVTWAWSAYQRIAKAVRQAGAELGVPVTWGGSWRTIKDGPHFELTHSSHPAAS